MASIDPAKRAVSATHRLFRRLLACAKSNDGTSAVEFGLVLPVLALVVTSVIDVGFGVHNKMQVEDAAHAGAQWAIKNGFDATAISSAVTSATNASAVSASPAPATFCGCASGSSVASATCGTTCPGGAKSGTYATVSAQVTYNTILNYPGIPNTYTFTSQSTVRLQ